MDRVRLMAALQSVVDALAPAVQPDKYDGMTMHFPDGTSRHLTSEEKNVARFGDHMNETFRRYGITMMQQCGGWPGSGSTTTYTLEGGAKVSVTYERAPIARVTGAS